MPLNSSDTVVYRKDVASRGHVLSSTGRESLLKPYLPTPNSNTSPREPDNSDRNGGTKRRGHRRRIRPWLKNKLFVLIQFVIQLVFGIFIRLRQILYALINRIIAILHYHHCTPEYIRKDVKNLSRIPEHLSVILKFKAEDDGGLEALMDEVAELCAWSAAANIGLLSVYEKSGILKSYMPALQELVAQKLSSYFGRPPATPQIRLFAPNHSSMARSRSSSPPPLATQTSVTAKTNINLLLLSATDGRDTLVDLTKTLTEMSQSQKIKPRDITPELINTEITATTAIPSSQEVTAVTAKSADKVVDAGEPDLLIIFGPYVKLDGYPPWQIRLTEIFCVGDSGADIGGNNSTRVEYHAFLRGLWKYAGAEQRFGR